MPNLSEIVKITKENDNELFNSVNSARKANNSNKASKSNRDKDKVLERRETPRFGKRIPVRSQNGKTISTNKK